MKCNGASCGCQAKHLEVGAGHHLLGKVHLEVAARAAAQLRAQCTVAQEGLQDPEGTLEITRRERDSRLQLLQDLGDTSG